MRRSLAGVALAVTSMVALSFLIPLGLLVMSLAREQSITAAEQSAAAMAPILALTTDPAELQEAGAGLRAAEHLVIHLPDRRFVGGPGHAPPDVLERAVQERESISRDVPGGWIYLQPVILPQDRVAVVENFVPDDELTRGVALSWSVMAGLAVVLLGGSVLVADRLGSAVVTSAKRLAEAARRLGAGNLDSRVQPKGPPELKEAGTAFNTMADRMTDLLAVERELVADLSHRLRTPLTALHLAVERIPPGAETGRIQAAVDELERELGAIIAEARTPLAVGPMGRVLRGDGAPEGPPADAERCEVAEVVGQRAGFWAVLAGQQGRPCQVQVTDEPTPVGLPESDITAVVDALVGNVFRYTPPGTALEIAVSRTAHTVEFAVHDAGPGIADPDGALARGGSTGSTGLGLDIARRAAVAAQGAVRITRGPLGGASVSVTFTLCVGAPQDRPRSRRRARVAGARKG
ncbi:HAMP domain-containing protein [Streptomyces bambusae]|uniref:HAMP domain-containing sensor histidine kinase n=1 Tax=Streptomyces bambusae TaxID=1550616 RepID=UPI001CFDAC91|nr:HAMP domain-containing sensor histidine kinase [Streptomyces bambusae]MCB5165857.1 HAMP domain-containing protein [Streptomyces bambusae]